MATRRTVLWGGAAAALLGPVRGRAEEGVVTLRAGRRQAALLGFDRPAVEIIGFADGPSPPVIRARQGEMLKLRFANDLDAEIWLHWFGVRGPSELMTINVPPGSPGVDCFFAPPDAGTYWLGPMADVSRLRDLGLYAMLVVEEAAPLADVADVPLVIDDWRLADDGSVAGGFGDVETMVGEGRLGNWFTVNGSYRPSIALPAGKAARLRLLNTANVRTMSLLFKGADPLLISADGQPVAPRTLGGKALALAPGQRADLLVLADDEVVVALDLFEDIAEIAYLTPGGGHPATVGDNFVLPANPLPALPQGAPRLVPVMLEGGIKGGLKSALFRGQPTELRALLEAGMGWAINGVAGPGGPPLVAAARGEAIIFAVDNRTTFDQPLHVHGHVWTATAPGAGDPAWRDTAIVPARSRVELLMVADNPGTWALQSLVAERADGGLLAAFTVSDDNGL